MSSLRFYASSCFKYLSVLVFVSFLSACSVSQPDAVLLDDNLVSSSSVSVLGGELPAPENDLVPDENPASGNDESVSGNGQLSGGVWTPSNSERVSDNDSVPGEEPVVDSDRGQVTDNDPVPAGNTTNALPAPDDNAKKLKVSWNAPLKREDNSTLALAEIAEYRVYYGSSKRDYKHVIVIDGNSTLQVEQSGVPAGKYYIAVTAVDRDGRESGYSQEITVII